MNVIRRIVVGIAGTVVVALALSLAAPKAVHAIVSTLVTVSNTTSQPVPTMAVDTRNVNVVNTPNVSVSSLPAVQLNGGSVNANVSNTIANPVPTIAEEAARAVVIDGACSFSLSNLCIQNSFYTVPTGETLVIESISELCRIDAGTAVSDVSVGFIAPGGGFVGVHVAPPAAVPQTLVSEGLAAGGQNLKTYASAGGISVEVIAASSESPVNDSCQLTLSGYLVP